MTQPQALTVDGSAYLVVTVQSVTRDAAIVVDNFGRQLTVRRDVMRAKAAPPDVGEQWMLDRTVGNAWTFAAIIGADLDTYYDQHPPTSIPVANADFSNIVLPYAGLVVLGTDNWLYRYTGAAWVRLRDDPLVVCRVRLSSDVSIFAGGSGNTLAQGGWSATEDPLNMFAVGGVAGNTYSKITIPVTANYRIQYRAYHLGPTTGFGEVHVMQNGTDPSNTVAWDQRPYLGGGGGAPFNALRERIVLNQNDQLYWYNFTNTDCTLKAISFTQTRTEITVVYDGPLTS